MPELNWLAVAAAAAVVFVVSSVYYVAFAARMVELRRAGDDAGGMQPWKVLVELIRSLVLGTVVAGLVVALGIADLVGAVQLAAALWIGFPVILLTGSVIWENVPAPLAAIHAGDGGSSSSPSRSSSRCGGRGHAPRLRSGPLASDERDVRLWPPPDARATVMIAGTARLCGITTLGLGVGAVLAWSSFGRFASEVR